MGIGIKRDGPPFKNGGTWRTQGKGPHDDVEQRVAYGLFHTPTVARFLDGVDIRELRVTFIGDEWRLMLKGRRGTRHLVCFFYAPGWREAYTLMVTSLDSGHVVWQPDRYPPRT